MFGRRMLAALGAMMFGLDADRARSGGGMYKAPKSWKPKFNGFELYEIRNQPTKKLREAKVKEIRAIHYAVDNPLY